MSTLLAEGVEGADPANLSQQHEIGLGETHRHTARGLGSNKRRPVQSAQKAYSSKPKVDSPRPVSTSYSTIILVLLFLPLLSSFLTDTYTFTLGSYLPPIRKIIATSKYNPFREPLRTLTPSQLAKYDGREDMPVYVAVGGEVYDVTANRRIYGRGGSYNMMAGRDASRSFVTGCFQTHLTHDLRGLTEDELKNWKSFFANHNDYRHIGSVQNPPIHPQSPIPPPCREDPSAAGAAGSSGGSHARARGAHDAHGGSHAPGARAAAHGAHKPGPVKASH